MLNLNLSIISGEYRTGKTYQAVRDAYEKYLHGYIVISNMWLSFPHIRWYESSDLSRILREIQQYHVTNITPYEAPDSYLLAHDIERTDIPSRYFYVLCDEGAAFFDARQYTKNFDSDDLKTMMVMPAHLNMQITVVVQELETLDKRFRDMTQEILYVSPAWFGYARRITSLDKNYVMRYGITPEAPVREKKLKIPYFQYKKDMSEFFGGLYFTKELLGKMAIRRSTDIVSLRQFLEKEDFLEDWRQPYLRKIEKMLTALSPSSEQSAPTPTGGVLAKETFSMSPSLLSTSVSENSERSAE